MTTTNCEKFKPVAFTPLFWGIFTVQEIGAHPHSVPLTARIKPHP